MFLGTFHSTCLSLLAKSSFLLLLLTFFFLLCTRAANPYWALALKVVVSNLVKLSSGWALSPFDSCLGSVWNWNAWWVQCSPGKLLSMLRKVQPEMTLINNSGSFQAAKDWVSCRWWNYSGTSGVAFSSQKRSSLVNPVWVLHCTSTNQWRILFSKDASPAPFISTRNTASYKEMEENNFSLLSQQFGWALFYFTTWPVGVSSEL